MAKLGPAAPMLGAIAAMECSSTYAARPADALWLGRPLRLLQKLACAAWSIGLAVLLLRHRCGRMQRSCRRTLGAALTAHCRSAAR